MVRGTDESPNLHGCAGVTLARRRLTPAPHAGYTLVTCVRVPVQLRVGLRSVRGSLDGLPFQRRSTAAPNNVRKTRSSSDDLLLLLGRQLLAIQSIVSSIVMVGSGSVIEFCGCTTPLYGRCGTAAELTADDPSLVQLASS